MFNAKRVHMQVPGLHRALHAKMDNTRLMQGQQYAQYVRRGLILARNL